MILENGEPINRTLPCIVCGKPLSSACDDYYNQPNSGTAFTSEGHYGSTIHDPMNGDWLELNVCDPCIMKNRDKIYYCKRRVGSVQFFDEVITEDDVVNWEAWISK